MFLSLASVSAVHPSPSSGDPPMGAPPKPPWPVYLVIIPSGSLNHQLFPLLPVLQMRSRGSRVSFSSYESLKKPERQEGKVLMLGLQQAREKQSWAGLPSRVHATQVGDCGAQWLAGRGTGTRRVVTPAASAMLPCCWCSTEPWPGSCRGHSCPTPTLRPRQAPGLLSPTHGVCAVKRESQEVLGAGSGRRWLLRLGWAVGLKKAFTLEDRTVMAVQLPFRFRRTSPGSSQSLLDPLLLEYWQQECRAQRRAW